MEESQGARQAVLRFYELFSAGDAGGFNDLLPSGDDGVLVIGTAPHEWHEGREKWIAQFGMEGVRLEPGENPRAWEAGDLAWFVDQPRFVFDGTPFPVRLTVVLTREDGAWKLVHGHFSVGIRDEDAMELLQRQSS